MLDNRLYEKIYGSLIGVAFGDAMGMPVEMLTPAEIKKYYGRITSFVRAIPEHPSHFLNAGSVTDDTLQTIFMAKILIKYNGKINARIFSKELIKWAEEKNILEISFFGPSTKKAIARLLEGEDPYKTGDRHVTNGAAMRIAPVGIVNAKRVNDAVKMAVEVTLPTHGSQTCVEGAAAIAAAISESFNEHATIDTIIKSAIAGATMVKGKGLLTVSPSVIKRIKYAIDIAKKPLGLDEIALELYDIIGFGMHIAETVPSALAMFYASKGNPIPAINAVVNVGGDTDTIASIIGAIGGAYMGVHIFSENIINTIERVNKLKLKEIAKELYRIISSQV